MDNKEPMVVPTAAAGKVAIGVESGTGFFTKGLGTTPPTTRPAATMNPTSTTINTIRNVFILITIIK